MYLLNFMITTGNCQHTKASKYRRSTFDLKERTGPNKCSKYQLSRYFELFLNNFYSRLLVIDFSSCNYHSHTHFRTIECMLIWIYCHIFCSCCCCCGCEIECWLLQFFTQIFGNSIFVV